MIPLHRDELPATRAPSGVMAGISVSDIAFPLSFTEASNHMTATQRQSTAKAPATTDFWWLRSPGSLATRAQFVVGSAGNFATSYGVAVTNAVRPALWIWSMQILYRTHRVSAGC